MEKAKNNKKGWYKFCKWKTTEVVYELSLNYSPLYDYANYVISEITSGNQP